MVRRLTLDGDGVAVVVGQAGTGQDVRARAPRARRGRRAATACRRGAARRAARELEEGAGIPSTSVAALLDALGGVRHALPRRAVLVVDEAGMVPTRQLAELVEHVGACRAKLVLVGDHRQLPEIEAGGAFRALASRLPVIELTREPPAGCGVGARRAARSCATASAARYALDWTRRTRAS